MNFIEKSYLIRGMDTVCRSRTRLVRRLAGDWGMGVLLVEHDVGPVMSTCDRIVVIRFGHVIAIGTPQKSELTRE